MNETYEEAEPALRDLVKLQQERINNLSRNLKLARYFVNEHGLAEQFTAYLVANRMER